MGYRASKDTVDHIAALVMQERPEWDPAVVTIVLDRLTVTVDGSDLAVAALRAAQNRDLPSPKAIGWRGPHWSGLSTVPLEIKAGPRCTVCGKREPQCYGQRPGRDDDHAFEPARAG